MPIPFPMNQGYPRDILRQSRALADTFSALFSPSQAVERVVKLASRDYQRLVLTGMGSSFHALHPLYLQMLQYGYLTWMVETSELIYHQSTLLAPGTLVIAVSQSGRSAEILRLLELARQSQTPVLGVSNTPGSPLAELATACLLTQAGDETSVSCKTYVAALMALSWLGDVLCKFDLATTRSELQQISDLVSLYLAIWPAHIAWLEIGFKYARHIFIAGRGSSLAAVGTGALITKESTHMHAEGMSSAAFRHGPMEMLADDVIVLIFAGSGSGADLNRNLAADITAQGGIAHLVDTNIEPHVFHLPPAPQRLLPMLEILPVEMLTLALGSLQGRTPGVFTRGAKVTTSE